MSIQQETQVDRKGGFECEFVELPPKIFLTECPVCLLVIRDPYQVTCCGYTFCQLCIENIKADNKPCPTCKTEVYTNFADKRLKRTLYAFKVRCSHQKDGCKWTGELGQLGVHLNTNPIAGKQLDGCSFVEINCFHCKKNMQRQLISIHENEHCIKRPFSCEHCHDYESNFDDITHNHWPVCESFPVPCPNECGSSPHRQNVDSHVTDVCPLTTISCDFLHVGCEVKLPRKDMPEHTRESFLQHMSLLATSHHNLAVGYARQQAQIISQQDQITVLNTSNEIMKVKLQTLKEENAQFRENQTALLRMQNKFKGHLEAPCTSIPLSPPVLTMAKYKRHKKDDDSWCSPPVYTHHQGYKICLTVSANGSGSGKGTHVSVYVWFKKGEFDDSLRWPFRGVISFRLVDQVNHQKHVTLSLTYDNPEYDDACSRVIEGEGALCGWGYPQFIAHNELEPKYLRHDTLLFEIHKVELRTINIYS